MGIKIGKLFNLYHAQVLPRGRIKKNRKGKKKKKKDNKIIQERKK